MPFSRYLQDDNDVLTNPPAFSHPVQLQLPSFVYNNIPTLALGGGAEVLPFSASSGFTDESFGNIFTAPNPRPYPAAQLPIIVPSSLGSVYSASGLDLLSILSRVATRPNPTIDLGPVDLACSFVIVDVRRHDHPIVYCSPAFSSLTGYPESEILGRNCRFLQAPGGAVSPGSPRHFTSPQSVAALKKSLSYDKEIQTSIVNFRKDGSAFINLVSVIPIAGGVHGTPEEVNSVVWHVGFQVDLTEQPRAILDHVYPGAYKKDPAPVAPWNQQRFLTNSVPQSASLAEKKKAHSILPPVHLSSALSTLLHDPTFMRSLPIYNRTTVPEPLSSADQSPVANHPLALLLLSYIPDFIHVVSLKGTFLYVAPAVTRVLGYSPTDLVGRTLADLTHPEDVVLLERQLRESSALAAAPAAAANQDADTSTATPQPVDIVFRARTKGGRYVWVECRGRVLVEPGKIRKVIVLSGRAREMAQVPWGGLRVGGDGFWAQLGGRGTGRGALVFVGRGAGDVLGWGRAALMGRRVSELIVGTRARAAVGDVLTKWEAQGDERVVRQVQCAMRTRNAGNVKVTLMFYRDYGDATGMECVSPANVLMQVRRCEEGEWASPETKIEVVSTAVYPPTGANLFAELETWRGSSWQYELQQLRLSNLRLLDEISALEGKPPARPEQSGDAAEGLLLLAQPRAAVPPLHATQLGMTGMELQVEYGSNIRELYTPSFGLGLGPSLDVGQAGFSPSEMSRASDLPGRPPSYHYMSSRSSYTPQLEVHAQYALHQPQPQPQPQPQRVQNAYTHLEPQRELYAPVPLSAPIALGGSALIQPARRMPQEWSAPSRSVKRPWGGKA